MSQDRFHTLLQEVADGKISVEDAHSRWAHLPYQDLGFARIDHHRELRQGAPEVIYGAGKTPAQIADIAAAMLSKGSNVLVTRTPEGTQAAMAPIAPDLVCHAQANLISVVRHAPPTKGRIAVVCAGTSDLPVATEAVESARFFGLAVEAYADVGVAGIHRVLAIRGQLEQMDLVIVVAGMDGALPSVVGGLVSCPVIAVPTSVGYGASFSGVAALLTMLNSCAAGVVVVNIDNGFGAAHAAHRWLHGRNRVNAAP